MRWLVVVAVMMLLVPVGGAAQTPVATPQASPEATPGIHVHWECDEISAYQSALGDIFDSLGLSSSEVEYFQSAMDTYLDDPEKVRPSQFRMMADILDEIATRMDQMPSGAIPLVAAQYHKAMVDFLSTMASMMISASTMGVLGALAYNETITEINKQVSDADDFGKSLCGDLWPDQFRIIYS